MSHSRKASTDMQGIRISQTWAAIQAERDFFNKADAQALTGTSSVFSWQLWRATKLTPKLMGTRRELYIREQGEAQQAAENELAVAASSARGARAVGRACRQRYMTAQEEDQERRGLKGLKEAAIAEFNRSQSKVDKVGKRDSSIVQEKCATFEGLEASWSSKRSVQNILDAQEGGSSDEPLAKKPSQGPSSETVDYTSKSAGDLLSVSEVGVSPIQTSVKIEIDASGSAPSDAESKSQCCLHCEEELGKEGCARPRLNCRDCSQVMHYDCYVQWAGSAPGPWDVVQCPAHSKLSKHRKEQKDAGKSTKSLKRSLSGVSRAHAVVSPKGSSRKIGSEATAKRCQSSSPTASSFSSPQAADEILSLAGKKASSETQTASPREAKGRSVSPTPSHSSEEDGTHHSPTASDSDAPPRNQARHQIPEKAVSVKSCGKVNDEELAMRLHRELNAPKRRRRGE